MALRKRDIQARLVSLPGWKSEGDEIVKVYTFTSYPKAVMFANAVAWLADAADHHPEIDVEYGKVTIDLTTHSAGGVTEKDFALAAQIDGLPGLAVAKPKAASGAKARSSRTATAGATPKPKKKAATAKKLHGRTKARG